MAGCSTTQIFIEIDGGLHQVFRIRYVKPIKESFFLEIGWLDGTATKQGFESEQAMQVEYQRLKELLTR